MADKLKMETKNLAEENYRKLIELFPNIVTETIDENKKTVRAIDVDLLQQEINEKVVEGAKERYVFTWPDKKRFIALGNEATTSTLRLDKEKSTGRDGTAGSIDTGNIYIEGDNLEALKLLRETYLGKIKVIYIDPPYNTGNDSFVYDDDSSMSEEEFVERSGARDEEGNLRYDFKVNNESNGRFHTDWLNMMYPRLALAKDLLADDGVIFISIDDNEQENLKKICDEIFGEKNFIATYIKQSKVGGGSDSKFIVREHEYALVYAKNYLLAGEMYIKHDPDYLTRYKETDDKGKYFWDTLARPGLKHPIYYDITAPDGVVLNQGWIHSKERFEKELSEGTARIIKKADGNWSVQFKQYLNVNGKKPRSLTMDFGGSIEGKNDLDELFDESKLFDYPKSVKFIKTLLNTIKSTDSIILDFFSGSATTAHAVMQLNAEDGGHRKFIMVQLPEECGEDTEAYKAGYKTICDIGEERIRRAGKKIKGDSPLTTDDLDIGFRVYRVADSNMENVFYKPSETTQDLLKTLAGNIKEDRTGEDLLIQIMLELGVDLSSKIEETEISGKNVFSVSDGYMTACFDNDVTDDVVTQIAKKEPTYAVFRDSGMASDSVMTNYEQIFKTYSPKTIVKVL